MNYKRKKILNNVFITIILLLSVLFLFSINGFAVEKYIMSASKNITFGDHQGIQITANGQVAYCTQRGKAYKTSLDESYMVLYDGGKTLGSLPSSVSNGDSIYWAGWGTWDIGKDGTLSSLTQTSSANMPIGKFGSYQSPGQKTSAPIIYEESDISDFGWTISQRNALSFALYYLKGNSTDDDNYRALQAVVWAIENKTAYASGSTTSDMKVIFKPDFIDTVNTYLKANTSGTEYYNSYNLVREFVWKMNNMKTIPSFAYDAYPIADNNPIVLKWDDKVGKYTTTLTDENGMLNYYDFNIDGVKITNNDDGTITITSDKKITEPVSNAKKKNGEIIGTRNEILPEDCEFPSVSFLKWEMEKAKKTPTFNYSLAIKQTGHSNEKWGCSWTCDDYGKVTHCTKKKNSDWVSGYWSDHTHDSDCSKSGNKYTCDDLPLNSEWVSGYWSEHTHTKECKHIDECKAGSGSTTATPGSSDKVNYDCTKTHYVIKNYTVKGNYINLQDVIINKTAKSENLVDPVYAYISVVTQEEAKAKVDVKTELLNQDGDVVDYIIPGEMYQVRYIYTYEGGSKGLNISDYAEPKYNYRFPYDTRLTTKNPNANIANDSIKEQREDYHSGIVSMVTNALILSKTGVEMYGELNTYETIYNNKAAYTWDSGNDFDDKLYLDARTELNKDEHLANTTVKEISSSSKQSPHIKKITKKDDKLYIEWQYETELTLFTAPICEAKASISINENKNATNTYYSSKYNYAYQNSTNYAGGVGYFDDHNIYTNNVADKITAEDRTLWQTNVDINISDVEFNSGAGVTQPVSIDSQQPVNYNLYYTLELVNKEAHKINTHIVNNTEGKTIKLTESPKFTIPDEIEFDINTLITLSQTGTGINNNNSLAVVDHIKTGLTYVQRVVPTSITVLKGSQTSELKATVEPNYDKGMYEDSYTITDKNKDTGKFVYKVSSARNYLNNKTDNDATDKIYPIKNLANNLPRNIQLSDSYNKTTQFNIQLGDGSTKIIKDRLTTNYSYYEFEYNKEATKNRVKIPRDRTSQRFYKFSDTTHSSANATTSNRSSAKTATQTEAYYINKVLFRSNYTKKSNYGNEGWVDMVNDNSKAVVSAGQGFELQVEVIYENSNLTSYQGRYQGKNDAVSSSTNVSSSNIKNSMPLSCNISALTGATTVSGDTPDAMTKYLITGSNVYRDLYASLSDNSNVVYSYSGIYDTPQIFDVDVKYSSDYKTTIMTYTMKFSSETGVNSTTQSMKFYTDALAADSQAVGVISNGNKADNVHSITLWTPVIAATGFDYPNRIADRYLGDAIEISYSITTSMSDDNISHIVQ